MYYLCSENKGADQLRGYHEADLRLCLSHMQNVGFLMTRLICCLPPAIIKAEEIQITSVSNFHNIIFNASIAKNYLI